MWAVHRDLRKGRGGGMATLAQTSGISGSVPCGQFHVFYASGLVL